MQLTNTISTLTKSLTLPYLKLKQGASAEAIGVQLDSLPQEALKQVCWFPVKFMPEVSFVMGYTSTGIYLKYYVSEHYFKATYLHYQDPVFKDSCVEFFVQLGDDANYYNLEFNALGTGRISYGINRHERQQVPAVAVKNLKRWVIKKAPEPRNNAHQWQITLVIPMEVFCFHDLKKMGNTTMRANFYKCGDDLPEVHYIAWNQVKSVIPDFHQPLYFGNLLFAGQ